MSARTWWLHHWFTSLWRHWTYRWPLSIFEKVVVANSAIILLETVAGWWITQHNPATYHYLIDTGFIALAALTGMALNFFFLRAAFAPLYGLLATIQAVEGGNLEARASARGSDADILALARAFNAMLDRLALARHDAAGRVLRAQEEERRRLALELHDQIGQSLTALTFHAEAIAQRLASESSRLADYIQRQAERLTALTQRTLAEVQALSRQLRPPLLDDLGLVAALHWLADDIRERFDTAVHVEAFLASGKPELQREEHRFSEGRQDAEPDPSQERFPEDLVRLPGDVETALFRIAQESLTNAIRHGHAEHIHVRLWQEETNLHLTVTDDGVGFPQLPEAVRGMGLEGMRERAQLLGGTLQVHSRQGDGCVVRVEIPLGKLQRIPGTSSAEGSTPLLNQLVC
jgi:two-component system sensor histidine kinase UhpB